MIKVLVFGDRSEKLFTEKLCQVLKEFGGVLGFCNDCAIEHEKNNAFLFVECDQLCELNWTNAILVFKSRQKRYNFHKFKISEQTVSIVEEGNERALRILKGSPALTLTCGMSPKDTLTLSSISENNAVVSLQREIQDLNGNIIEPCEIKITYKEAFSKFELLTICGILLLSGKINYSKIEL